MTKQEKNIAKLPYTKDKCIEIFFIYHILMSFGPAVLACSVESAILRYEAIKAGRPEASLVNVHAS